MRWFLLFGILLSGTIYISLSLFDFPKLNPFWSDTVYELSSLLALSEWITPEAIKTLIKGLVLILFAFVFYLLLGLLLARHQLYPSHITVTMLTFTKKEGQLVSVRADVIQKPIPLQKLYINRFLRWLILFKFFTTSHKKNKYGLIKFGKYAPYIFKPIIENLSDRLSRGGSVQRNAGIKTLDLYYKIFLVSTLETGDMSSRPKFILIQESDFNYFAKKFPDLPKRGIRYYQIAKNAASFYSPEEVGKLRITIEDKRNK